MIYATWSLVEVYLFFWPRADRLIILLTHFPLNAYIYTLSIFILYAFLPISVEYPLWYFFELSESDDDMYSWDRFETTFENSRERIVDNKKSSIPVSPTAKELTEKEMETKTRTILDEYLHFQDTKVTLNTIEHLN